MDFNYSPPASDYLAPARRAGIGLFVLAALGLVCGACVGVGAWIQPMDRIIDQLQRSGYKLPDTGGDIPLEQLLRIGYTVMAVMGVLAGIAFIILGIFVRRGGKTSAIISLVFCVPLIGVSLYAVAATLVMGPKNPTALFGVVMVLVPTGLLVLVMTWLIQAIRAASQVSIQQQMMMAQMWQYQQQQAAYGGYHQTPVNPAPGYGGYTPPPPYAAPPSNSPGAIGPPGQVESQSETLPPNPPDAAP